MRALVLVLLTLSLGPSDARADALEPPPTDCAPGMMGQSSRSGGYCAPTRCDEQTQCPTTGERVVCSAEPIGLCVLRSVSSGMRPGPTGGVPWEETNEVALGPCGEDGSCSGGAVCQLERRCLYGAAAPAAGCGGCTVARSDDTMPRTIALAAIAMALLGWRRRAR